MARTLLRPLVVITLAVAASSGLAACSSGSPAVTSAPPTSAGPTETTAPTTPVNTPTETVTPTATPTATSTAIAGSPVGVNCDQLVTAQQFYDYNANFTLSDSYSPKAGSRAAAVLALDGIACEWVNDSSNEKIDLAVANLGQQGMLAQQDKLKTDGAEVEVGGTSGYFATSGTVGRTDAFAVKYWIVADSATFATADDASQLITDVIGNLPK